MKAVSDCDFWDDIWVNTGDFIWEDRLKDFPLFLLIFNTHCDKYVQVKLCC
jgi:hypothetical protein